MAFRHWGIRGRAPWATARKAVIAGMESKRPSAPTTSVAVAEKGDGTATSCEPPTAQPGPQTEFLNADADIVVFGGGKTYGLLLESLKKVGNGHFDFVVFRRTSPQITAPGGLWDAASEIYPLAGATPNLSTMTWRFPSGAKGVFRHLQYEHNIYDWQGAEIPLICFDELTHFTEKQFFYLLSRNRSTSGVRPYVRATTNPGPGWVKGFLAPWVDKGFPNPAASGEVRHFARIGGEIVWVDGGWRDRDGHGPKSMTFIRSLVHDNPKLLEVNPEYLVNLKSLASVEQAQLLFGDWDVFAGAYFSEWLEAEHTAVPELLPGWWAFFGGIDYGQAAPFAFVLCASDEEGNVTVLDEVYQTRLQPSEQAQRVRQALDRHGVEVKNCPIWTDPSVFPPKAPEARRGHPGKYIAEEYWDAGLNVVAANNDRLNGWARVRDYLHRPGALRMFKGRCPNLIRTFPMAVYSAHSPEDMDTNGEDHALDALRYALMSRPSPGKDPSMPATPADWRPEFLKRRAPYYE